jgi:putative membrane protein
VSGTATGGPALETTQGAGPEDGWQHLHPLSPLLRGGIAFVAVVAYVLSQQLDSLFGADREDPTQGHLGWAVVAVLAVLVAIMVGAWFSWRFSRYRVTASMIELRTGLLYRQHRQVPFDRIQAVDTGRPLLARLTGLAQVVVQSAGGKDSHLTLAFLTHARAEQLREQLMELARHPHGAAVPVTEPANGEAPLSEPGWSAAGGDPVLRVPNARVTQSVLYSGPGLVIVLAAPALVASVALGAPEMVAWLGPTLLAVGTSHLKRLTQECNFELLHQGDRLRIRHGLTDLRTTTVPVHRIQAIQVSQSLAWRLTGWWRIEVNVAGAGHGDEATQTVLMPVGTLEETLRVLALVRPGIPREAALAAMLGHGKGHGFVSASRRARVLDPLSWRRLGYTVLPEGLLTRRGVAYRAAQFVPHARVQSLTVRQGPIQRARGVATVRLVSTPGPVTPVVEHLDVDEALRLVNEQVVRSSAARRAE